MRKKIRRLLKELRFLGMEEALGSELDRAESQGAPAAEVLYRLLAQEQHYRKERSLAYSLRHAKIPWDFSLETFPFARQKGVKKSQILALADLSFLQRADNIVLIGKPGVGKTGLAISLLRHALTNGHRGRFYKAQDLLDELYSSLADRSTTRLMKTLCRYDLLVIDELGYLTLSSHQVNAFFKLMDERHGRKSTIITTNLPYEKWYDLFQRKSLVDALLDRLKQHCVTIKIDGPSLRNPGDDDTMSSPV